MAKSSFVLRMNGGDDSLSYASNSGLQKFAMSKLRHVLDETIEEMMVKNGSIETFRIVDLGCSSGPNTFIAMSLIIKTLKSLHRDESYPQYEIYLNDLPSNDYNNLFKMLPDFHRGRKDCFVFALPGSFYGRLLPSNSLQFGYSCYCLHWLSQIPEGLGMSNKENICIVRTSPLKAFEAYAKQYERDFSTFLKCRGEEMMPNGRMVLAFVGRKNVDHRSEEDVSGTLRLLVETLSDMVNEGLISKEDLDSFNMPIYYPSQNEVKTIIEQEGSFNMDKMEAFEVPWDANGYKNNDNEAFDAHKSGKSTVECVRAFIEPMLTYHFRNTSMDIDYVFDRYEQNVVEHIHVSMGTPSYHTLLLSLKRKF
ncbi:benzoate carboxyl methyltransferase-like [Andrographis paniculata]|uniref:benzoate carboxyl methyltransferase-like n=1 Tax=Andrographis paniculata TaxID=175694 RepID=UPI0021E9A52B|nr:benzoate carboxyl methyltransferase-like [Andrographis paniculata]